MEPATGEDTAPSPRGAGGGPAGSHGAPLPPRTLPGTLLRRAAPRPGCGCLCDWTQNSAWEAQASPGTKGTVSWALSSSRADVKSGLFCFLNSYLQLPLQISNSTKQVVSYLMEDKK